MYTLTPEKLCRCIFCMHVHSHTQHSTCMCTHTMPGKQGSNKISTMENTTSPVFTISLCAQQIQLGYKIFITIISRKMLTILSPFLSQTVSKQCSSLSTFDVELRFAWLHYINNTMARSGHSNTITTCRTIQVFFFFSAQRWQSISFIFLKVLVFVESVFTIPMFLPNNISL